MDATLSSSPIFVAQGADTHGDFAAGLRRVDPSPVAHSSFATGLRARAARLNVGDFATGIRTRVGVLAVGDFATGVRAGKIHVQASERRPLRRSRDGHADRSRVTGVAG
ncbi:MAG: hypothetical protein ACLPV4_21355 [Solirubrobacteraceae bacterium]